MGTAWTFSTQNPVNKFFSWGNNESGELGQGKHDDPLAGSTPVQIPVFPECLSGLSGCGPIAW